VKAVGGGLGLPLDRFEVEYEPPRAEPDLRLLDETEPRPWTLRTLDPGPGFVGALAVPGAGWRLACFDWTA
jgi:4'-phosphopantetheinyl transferase